MWSSRWLLVPIACLVTWPCEQGCVAALLILCDDPSLVSPLGFRLVLYDLPRITGTQCPENSTTPQTI
jgi:hypothetical protein